MLITHVVVFLLSAVACHFPLVSCLKSTLFVPAIAVSTTTQQRWAVERGLAPCASASTTIINKAPVSKSIVRNAAKILGKFVDPAISGGLLSGGLHAITGSFWQYVIVTYILAYN